MRFEEKLNLKNRSYFKVKGWLDNLSKNYLVSIKNASRYLDEYFYESDSVLTQNEKKELFIRSVEKLQTDIIKKYPINLMNFYKSSLIINRIKRIVEEEM